MLIHIHRFDTYYKTKTTRLYSLFDFRRPLVEIGFVLAYYTNGEEDHNMHFSMEDRLMNHKFVTQEQKEKE